MYVLVWGDNKGFNVECVKVIPNSLGGVEIPQEFKDTVDKYGLAKLESLDFGILAMKEGNKWQVSENLKSKFMI